MYNKNRYAEWKVQVVNNMKTQTFGVEIEMNNIKRERAAELAAEFFGTHRYAWTHGTNGYYTWSAWDAQGREWKFQKDVSIAGPDDYKCEMVTPILRYDDIETLQELARIMRRHGAKSDATRGCGIHIHIGATGHTPKSLRNLANIMASHETLLTDALAINRSRLNQYCRPVDPRFLREVNEKKPQTMSELADVWYQSQGCDYRRDHHYNSSRYHMLNLHATFTKGTIEFRLFQFDTPTADRRSGIHAGALKAYIQLCLALSQMAKDARNTTPREVQSENQKYAMRTWLLKLGMIGDEFETARDILTRKLAGDSRNRHGRQSA